jgi:hypothetical protein
MNKTGLPDFIAELKPRIRQNLPKKIVLTDNFILGDQSTAFKKNQKPYDIRITYWVADVPYSRIEPKIALTLSGGGKWFRIVFSSIKQIEAFITQIKAFFKQNKKALANALKQAQKEQKKLWKLIEKNKKSCKKNKRPCITTIQLYTTIQGLRNKKRVLSPHRKMDQEAKKSGRSDSYGLSTTDADARFLSSCGAEKEPDT